MSSKDIYLDMLATIVPKMLKSKNIYLDTAATTKPKQAVLEAMLPYLTDKWYNPSSLYAESRRLEDEIKTARKIIGDFIGAKSEEIYFTSGGSESNCWAIQGFVNYWSVKGFKPVVVTSTIEHKSIMSCVKNLFVDKYFVDVNLQGEIKLNHLENILEDVSKQNNVKVLVSIQYANNEIGIIQDIPTISKIVHKYSAYIHTDAVQIVGHLPVNVKNLDIDMLSASGHKFGGVKGTGFLYIKNGVEISPLIYGSQNNNMRGGTENVAGIIGMGKALQLCNVSFDVIDSRADMKRKFMGKLSKLSYNIKFNNLQGCLFALPTVISLTIEERITAEALIYMLNAADICIASGSACNSHNEEPSYVLRAIGLSDEDAIRTIRISFDDDITEEDMDRFIAELDKAIKVLIV